MPNLDFLNKSTANSLRKWPDHGREWALRRYGDDSSWSLRFLASAEERLSRMNWLADVADRLDAAGARCLNDVPDDELDRVILG